MQNWYQLRDQFESRQENHRLQFRFRKDPATYLAVTEDLLIKAPLPS